MNLTYIRHMQENNRLKLSQETKKILANGRHIQQAEENA